jgi:hypothetical protein
MSLAWTPYHGFCHSSSYWLLENEHRMTGRSIYQFPSSVFTRSSIQSFIKHFHWSELHSNIRLFRLADFAVSTRLSNCYDFSLMIFGRLVVCNSPRRNSVSFHFAHISGQYWNGLGSYWLSFDIRWFSNQAMFSPTCQSDSRCISIFSE